MRPNLATVCSWTTQVITFTFLFCLLGCSHEDQLSYGSSALGQPLNFIKRVDDRLYDGDREYRFMGLAASNIHQNEEQLLDDYSNRFPDDFEIKDTLLSIKMLGGSATRSFPPSLRKTGGESVPVYVEGFGQYNEEAFRTLDRVLMHGGNLDVRVIIPLIDSHSFWGWRGVGEFASYRGKTGIEFWTDAEVKSDFKQYISDFLNRKNNYTGVTYKDDPAILAIQLGNELDSYIYDNKLHLNAKGEPDKALEDKWQRTIAQWSTEMAAYIKSIDTHHLVMEGGGDRNIIFGDPNIDVISEHYYAYWNEMAGRSTDLAALNRVAKQSTQKAHKALIADEFGMSETPVVRDLMQEIINNGTSGGLLWGIRSHRRDGGYFYHNESNTKFNSYRFPGFKSGDGFDERTVLTMLRDSSFKIRGLATPPLPAPDGTPQLLPQPDLTILRWRGTTGASYYVIERADECQGTYQTISQNATDDDHERNFFHDREAKSDKTYCYRVKGVNASGSTPFSDVMKIQVTGHGIQQQL